MALAPHYRPASLLIGLVVFILPRCTAACAAVAGDGDKAVLVVAVAIRPHVLLPVAALVQLGMARCAPPVALNAQARLAQGHFFEFVLSVRVFGHDSANVAVARSVASGSGIVACIPSYFGLVLFTFSKNAHHASFSKKNCSMSCTGHGLRQLRHVSSAFA